jgi:hypothetical protein
VTFASGFTAVSDTSVPGKAKLTQLTLGARGNGLITEPVESVPSAITAAQPVVGLDAFGESFIPRHQGGVDSPVPASSTYDVTNVRNRYLSRAIAIGSRNRVTVILHDVRPPVQLRVRVATGSDSAWKPWKVVTGDGSLFTFTEASPITKVQLEIFGRCRGYSLFEGDT